MSLMAVKISDMRWIRDDVMLVIEFVMLEMGRPNTDWSGKITIIITVAVLQGLNNVRFLSAYHDNRDNITVPGRAAKPNSTHDRAITTANTIGYC